MFLSLKSKINYVLNVHQFWWKILTKELVVQQKIKNWKSKTFFSCLFSKCPFSYMQLKRQKGSTKKCQFRIVNVIPTYTPQNCSTPVKNFHSISPVVQGERFMYSGHTKFTISREPACVVDVLCTLLLCSWMESHFEWMTSCFILIFSLLHIWAFTWLKLDSISMKGHNVSFILISFYITCIKQPAKLVLTSYSLLPLYMRTIKINCL